MRVLDATFATILQLTLLLLLVRQMESTRTPSLLSKVSLWTIVIMGITDSWIFSAHVVMGILSDSKLSIGLLVPGFLGLCSAVVFGPVSRPFHPSLPAPRLVLLPIRHLNPRVSLLVCQNTVCGRMLILCKRYAVLLHRIQAPERVSSPPPNRVVRPVPVSNTNPPVPAEPTTDTPATNGTSVTTVTPVTPVVTATTTTTGDDDRPFTLREFIYNNPGVRCEFTPSYLLQA